MSNLARLCAVLVSALGFVAIAQDVAPHLPPPVVGSAEPLEVPDMPPLDQTPLSADERFARTIERMQIRLAQLENSSAHDWTEDGASLPNSHLGYDTDSGFFRAGPAVGAGGVRLWPGNTPVWVTIFPLQLVDEGLVLWTQSDPGSGAMRQDEVAIVEFLTVGASDLVCTLGTGSLPLSYRPIKFHNVGDGGGGGKNVLLLSQQTPALKDEMLVDNMEHLDDIVLLPGDWIQLYGFGASTLSADACYKLLGDGRRSVHSIDNGDTPFTVTPGLERVIRVDATAGPVTVILAPAGTGYSTVSVIKTDASGNAVTVQGTIEGAANRTLATQFARERYRHVGGAVGWTILG